VTDKVRDLVIAPSPIKLLHALQKTIAAEIHRISLKSHVSTETDAPSGTIVRRLQIRTLVLQGKDLRTKRLSRNDEQAVSQNPGFFASRECHLHAQSTTKSLPCSWNMDEAKFRELIPGYDLMRHVSRPMVETYKASPPIPKARREHRTKLRKGKIQDFNDRSRKDSDLYVADGAMGSML